jgi:hypothetical protein
MHPEIIKCCSARDEIYVVCKSGRLLKIADKTISRKLPENFLSSKSISVFKKSHLLKCYRPCCTVQYSVTGTQIRRLYSELGDIVKRITMTYFLS